MHIFQKDDIFKNVPPSTPVPRRSPGRSPAIPSPTRANIGHPAAVLSDVRGQKHRKNWGQFLIKSTVTLLTLLTLLTVLT